MTKQHPLIGKCFFEDRALEILDVFSTGNSSMGDFAHVQYYKEGAAEQLEQGLIPVINLMTPTIMFEDFPAMTKWLRETRGPGVPKTKQQKLKVVLPNN